MRKTKETQYLVTDSYSLYAPSQVMGKRRQKETGTDVVKMRKTGKTERYYRRINEK